jgi:hypothetical protein
MLREAMEKRQAHLYGIIEGATAGTFEGNESDHLKEIRARYNEVSDWLSGAFGEDVQ